MLVSASAWRNSSRAVARISCAARSACGSAAEGGRGIAQHYVTALFSGCRRLDGHRRAYPFLDDCLDFLHLPGKEMVHSGDDDELLRPRRLRDYRFKFWRGAVFVIAATDEQFWL